ncbi:MAG: hypothetical protein QOH97_1016 [Actinoplanes sp.]|nr:hypothetical protein [Actinoplanes sp.]
MRDVTAVRLRWIGYKLHAEADIVVDAGLSLPEIVVRPP